MHIFNSFKLVMFLLVGTGWLSVQKYLGSLPVVDIMVMLSVLICSSTWAWHLCWHRRDFWLLWKPGAYSPSLSSLWQLCAYSETWKMSFGYMKCKSWIRASRKLSDSWGTKALKSDSLPPSFFLHQSAGSDLLRHVFWPYQYSLCISPKLHTCCRYLV